MAAIPSTQETSPGIASVERPTSGYLKTLDGWRAIAVLSVIAYHFKLVRAGALSDAWVHRHGLLGVDLFFSISGLLICSRLLDEETRTGRISLRNFYVRRTFRIVPPMLAYLVALAGLAKLNVIHVGRAAWFASLLFVNNYYSFYKHEVDWSPYTNHFWSLAVEEHFYLLLPAVLVFFPRARVKVLASLTGACLVWYIVYSAMERHNIFREYAESRSDLRLDGLLFPALLALLLQRRRILDLAVRYCRPAIVLPCVAAAGVLAFAVSNSLAYRVVVPFGFPFVVLSTVLHARSMAGRLLESLPLRALGRISYSVYLWQQLFFTVEEAKSHGTLHVLQAWPWNMLATLTLASASFYLLEKPCVRLGHRFAPPATPGHRDLEIKSPPA